MITLALMVAAQIASAPPAQAAEVRAILEPLQQHTSVTAAIRQVKVMRAFTRPQEAHGRLIVLPPRRLRWEYTTPFRATLVLSGDRVTMAYPELGRRRTIDLNQDPGLKSVLDAILFFMEADPNAVIERFEVTIAAGAQTRLQLVPRAEAVRALLARVDVVVDTERNVLTSIRLEEPDGDHTTLTFSGVEVDKPVDEALLVP